MGADGLEWRCAARADRLKQAVLEPAAVLVAAFQIEVGRPRLTAVFDRKTLCAAAFEPHVDDIHNLLVIRGGVIGAEEAAGVRGIPSIGPFGGKDLDHAGEHGRIAQWLVGGAVDEHGHGHAPGALAADAPIGPPGDHAGQAGAAGFGDEPRAGDGVQRTGPDMFRPVHADEPLRRRAVDDGRLAAPAMRIGVV